MARSTATIKTSTLDPKQRRFPSRRHNAQHRRSLLGSEKERRQSSLTQLDFVSTPANQDEIIPISSDHEDEDFVEPQPKKKQRLSKDGKASEQKSKAKSKRKSMTLPKSREDVGESQNTFTQMPFLPSARSGKTATYIDDEDDVGFDIFADGGRDEYTALSRRQKPRLPCKDKTESPQRDYHQSQGEANLSLLVVDSPARRYNLRSPAKKADTPDTLAVHNIAAHDFTTPKKPARQEIPSSQTPPSIKLSTRRTQRSQPRAGFQRSPLRDEYLQRSPLKEKSTNISPSKPREASPKKWTVGSPESQNPTMKMLERTRLRLRTSYGAKPQAVPTGSPSKDSAETARSSQPSNVAEAALIPSTALDLSTSAGKEAITATNENKISEPERVAHSPASQSRKRKAAVTDDPISDFVVPTQPAPRKLKRTATVQDSQHESLSWPTQGPRRKLRRVNTVQDSQHGDIDLSSSIYRTVSHENQQNNEDDQDEPCEMFDIEDEEGNTYGTVEPQTYDPASAALDRDAARGLWTQTQAVGSRIADSIAGSPSNHDEETVPEDEEDEDDLDRGVIPASDDDEEIIMLSSPAVGTSQELGDEPGIAAKESQNPGDAITTTIGEKVAPAHQDPTNPEVAVPEASPSPPSSPPIHPSQISTVVPTQRSLHPSSTHRQDEAAEEDDYSPPTSPPAPEPVIPVRRGQDFTFNDLPQSAATLTHSAITLSSSPLPLPPWTSESGEKWDVSSPRRKGKGNETQNESLQDFSLPPPPPMLRTSSPFARLG